MMKIIRPFIEYIFEKKTIANIKILLLSKMAPLN